MKFLTSARETPWANSLCDGSADFTEKVAILKIFQDPRPSSDVGYLLSPCFLHLLSSSLLVLEYLSVIAGRGAVVVDADLVKCFCFQL
jgi:hypothetical protein